MLKSTFKFSYKKIGQKCLIFIFIYILHVIVFYFNYTRPIHKLKTSRFGAYTLVQLSTHVRKITQEITPYIIIVLPFKIQQYFSKLK